MLNKNTPHDNAGHFSANGKPAQERTVLEKRLLAEASRRAATNPPPNDPVRIRREQIVENAPWMIEDFGGRCFATASQIEKWLADQGSPRELTGMTGWADGTGGYGLNLPYLRWKGCAYYDLTMVSATEEKKASHQNELSTVDQAVIGDLVSLAPSR